MNQFGQNQGGIIMNIGKVLLGMFGLLLAALVLAGCGGQPMEPTATLTPIPATPTSVPPTATSVPPTRTPIPIAIPDDPFPFSLPGPYQYTSLYGTVYVDAARNRTVGLTITYPARNGAPDFRAAPYPLILSSTKVLNVFGDNLASYGFVTVGINYIDTYMPWDNNLIDQPLDILFALDQLAVAPPEILRGMIDTEQAGTMGYSFDGYNSLAMSGARVDPDWYLERCADPPAIPPIVVDFGVEYYCTIAEDWEAFAAHAGPAITTSQVGLWQPMTDERIRAVMPMGAEGVWLFGERGLAAVDRPTLLIQATKDQYCPYEEEAVYIYDHIGTPDRFLISFVDQEHMMIYDREQVSRMQHFSVAFFGTYLQGRKNYAEYFSEEFVSAREGLAWGVVEQP
jgi:predicted dienelactone hydrolase